VRRLPEGALEGAGEVRLAALKERAQIRDEDRTDDMTIAWARLNSLVSDRRRSLHDRCHEGQV